MSTQTPIADHWAGHTALYDPSVHQPGLRKADRVKFAGAGGITVYGNIGSLTAIGYRIAVPVTGIVDDALWVEVAADQVSLA